MKKNSTYLIRGIYLNEKSFMKKIIKLYIIELLLINYWSQKIFLGLINFVICSLLIFGFAPSLPATKAPTAQA